MDNMPLRDVTEEEIETYWRDGVVHLPNIMGMEWIERMRTALDRILEDPGQYGNNINPDGSEGRFAFESFMWIYDDNFKDLAFDSPLAPIAAQVLRSKRVHHLFDFYFSKEPHTPQHTLWHQDQGGNPVHGRQVAGSWVPLDVVTVESGAVEYIRGSHNWNRWFVAPIDDEPKVTESDTAYDLSFEQIAPGGDTDGGDDARIAKYDEVFEPQPDFESMRDELDIVTFDSKPGDVVLNHLSTVHHAPGNLSDRRRRALGARWSGDDAVFAKRQGYFTARLPWDPGLNDGDPFPDHNDMFRLVWPREAQSKTKAAE